MRLIASVQLKKAKNREILLQQINAMGLVPHLKGNTITVVVDGHFTGTFISLVGTMDGAEFSEEDELNEVENGARFENGAGI